MGDHSGECSLQMSGSLSGGTVLLTARAQWWFQASYGWQVPFSRCPLPYLVENLFSTVSNLLILGECSSI